MKWQLFLIAIAFTGNAVHSDQHRNERDFSINLQEAKEREQEAFSKADGDSDGRVSLSEFAAMADNRHEQDRHRPRHNQRTARHGPQGRQKHRPGDKHRMRQGPKSQRMRSGVHGPRMKPRHRGSDMAPRGRPNTGNHQEYRPGDERNREMRERRLFGLADIDKSGQLSIDEFLGRGKAVRASMRSRGVKARFDAMDKNQDGQVDRGEFPSRFPMLEKMDTDGDGQITREEMSKGRRDEGPR
ncbi:MAG: EF-hand domain-containing protein [Pseudomonadales bacterium]|jgi:Ca2+-binding EF-hand superfamily protein